MAPATAVAKQNSRTPQQQVRDLLEVRKAEFAAALAGRVDPEAFIRVAYATITKTPKLLEATSASLLMSLLEAASLGLVPNGVMGEAYIVPFNNKVKENGKERWEVQAQFIPGYRGLIKLARQSGVVRNIVPRAVYEGDRFEVEYGLTEKLVHVPDLSAPTENRKLTHVYAVAHFHDGDAPQFEVMSRKQVDGIRARSKAKDSGPWVSDYDAMALKTVIRRLFKYVPSSDTDLTRAIEADNREYETQEIAKGVTLHIPAATRTEELRDRIAAPKEVGRVEEESGAAKLARQLEADDQNATASAESDAEPSPVERFGLLIADTKASGKGKSATTDQRVRIGEIATALEDQMDIAPLIKLAEDAALSTGQAGKLIVMGKDACDSLDIVLASQLEAEKKDDTGQEDLL